MASRRRNRVKGIFKKKRFKFIGLSKADPPTSIRYCLRCEKNRTFKYNQHIGHSECVNCGSRLARRKE